MLVFKKYGFQTKIKSNLNEEGVFFSFVPRAFHDSLCQKQLILLGEVESRKPWHPFANG